MGNQTWVLLLLMGGCTFTTCAVKAQAQAITAGTDGTGTLVTPRGNQLDISGGTQAGGNLFHSFQDFGLGANQVANFLSQPGTHNILGRVTGGNVSVINGLVQVTGSNANLYLMNPAGIVFGANASLNVSGSFIATTANGIGFGADQWFDAIGTNDYAAMVGDPTQFALTVPQPGTILNAGNLAVGQGQTLMLLGGTVINTGTLTASGGKIAIAALAGDKLVRLTPAGSLLSLDLPLATKATLAPAPLTPPSLPTLLTGGTLAHATGITVEQGIVRLIGTHTTLPTEAGTTVVSGQLSVATETAMTAGTIHILGNTVGVVGASINAAGVSGGGTVLIGGDYQGQGVVPNAQTTFVDATSRITVDAIGTGDGGRAIVWADETTHFAGAVSARGGNDGGNGGLVETSGKVMLDVTGAQVDASAPQGLPGTWLLDPTDIAIQNGGTDLISSGVFDPTGTGSTVSSIAPTVIAAALDSGTNVTITTASGANGNGDIRLLNSIQQTGRGTASLTLVGRRFTTSGGSTINLSSTGGLTFAINQINPEAIAPASSIQSAIAAIGTVAGTTTIDLGAATYVGTPIRIDQSVTINGAGATNTVISGGNTFRVVDIASGVTATLRNLTVTGGNATATGGGIRNQGNLTLANSRVTNNIAATGGGIHNTGNLTITTSTLSGNQSTNNNGGAIFNGGTVTIRSSTFNNNRADDSGGGIFNSGTATIINSTLSGNVADSNRGGVGNGGGIFNSGRLLVNSSTVTLNQSRSNQGGGIFNTGTASLLNTIVAANSGLAAPDVLGPFNDGGNNLIGVRDGSTGFTVSILVGTRALPLPPGLAPLADNGGPTQTHALLATSPALNTGNTAIGIDQRGVVRPQGNGIDIGAFESFLNPLRLVTDPRLFAISQSPIPNRINPTNLTSNPTRTNLPIQTRFISSQTDQALAAVDQALSQAYEKFLQLSSAQFGSNASLTLQQLQQILTRVKQEKGLQPAIIYAVFVPQVITPTTRRQAGLAVATAPISIFFRANEPRDDDRLELLLITPAGRLVRHSLTVTRAQVIQQAQLFRMTTADVEDDQSFTVLARQLYSWLLEPLVADLQQENITSLIYCLDEGLRTIPIAAMRHDSGFAIERYSMSIIPSVGLTDYRIAPSNDLIWRTLLALGVERFTSLEPLPAVPTEVELVSQQFWQGSVVLNENLTLQNLINRKRLENPGIIHLATHARFNEGAPNQSYIQLWDEQITLDQMRSLDWGNPPLELLVLSACTTALGSPNAELGFAGLAAAAGVRSTLGSLWAVSDIGTLALMSEFYIQLKNAATRTEALQRAQLALLRGEVRIDQNRLLTSRGSVLLPAHLVTNNQLSFKHPFYWSPFVLIGNPW